MCKKHRDTPIEFFCNISNEFYCKLCAKNHSGHNDICVAKISNEVQESLVQLKHIYLTKRTHIFDRLISHQNKIEEFFKIYYQFLDEQRSKVLGNEYKLREMMEGFENRMKRMMNKTQRYSVVEFFLEQNEIKDEIYKMQKELNSFSIYMPEWNLKSIDDIEAVKKHIRDNLSQKLKENLIPIDNRFAMENYEYATTELGNEAI